jgi:hypothetical protein
LLRFFDKERQSAPFVSFGEGELSTIRGGAEALEALRKVRFCQTV